MRKKILLILLIFLIALFSCSKKEPTPPEETKNNTKQVQVITTGPKRVVYINTFRFGRQPITVEQCIENGIIAAGMTLAECNEAVKGEFVLKTELEKNWDVYSHNGANIFFKDKIVNTIQNLQAERVLKVLRNHSIKKE